MNNNKKNPKPKKPNLFKMKSMSFPNLGTEQMGMKSEVQQMLVKSGSLLHMAIKCKN